jgi:hypothetical protein
LRHHQLKLVARPRSGFRSGRSAGEPVRRAVHHLGYHCKRLHGSGADARRQQQIGKVFRSSVGGGREISTEPPRNHVIASDIVSPAAAIRQSA